MLYILYIIIIVFVVVVVLFQNCQVIVSIGDWAIVSTLGASPKVLIIGVLATSGGRWVRDEMEGDSDIVIEDVYETMSC